MRRLRTLLGTAAVAIGMVALVAILWSNSASFLASTWRERLERIPENQVDDLLERLAELDEAGLPALADALASRRESVAQGAAVMLRRQTKGWQGLEVREATRRRRILAKALADDWPRYGPAARGVAAEIVAGLLSQSAPEGSLSDADFLAACAEVMRSGAESGVLGPRQPASAGDMQRPLPNSAAASQRQESSPSPQGPSSQPGSTDGSTFAEGPSLPKGASPWEPAPMPPGAGEPLAGTEPAMVESLPKTAALRVPDRAGVAGAPRGFGQAESPSDTQDDAPDNARGGVANGPRRLPPVRAAGFDDQGLRVGAPDALLKSAAELRQLASRLHDQDPQQVETARKELKRSGLSDVELDLARQLTHPDAGVRRSFARALPDTAGIDAAPWLLELSRDPDADVRLQAITLLATTGDPALLAQLRPLVQADSDERIQRLSDRLFPPAAVADKKGEARGGIRK